MFGRIVLMALLVIPGSSFAQDVTEGENLYLDYCATCHGLDADGQGPMAPAMSLQPTNLTLLEAVNNGTFPTKRVVMRIDGREPLISHGSPMPVFGDFFEGDDTAIKAETGQPIMTSQPVVDLVAYLRTLQQ